jgi:hypothetical protein
MIKPGTQTTEFKVTAGGMFLAALFAALAAFNVLNLSEAQEETVYQLAAASWIFLPMAYTFGRSYVKGKSVSPPPVAGVSSSSSSTSDSD